MKSPLKSSSRIQIPILCGVFILLSCLLSCTQDFETINTNPNAVEKPNPNYVFTKSQLDGLNNNYYFTSIVECGAMVQHYATYKEASGSGDKYLNNEVHYSAYFSQAYPTAINEIAIVLNTLKETPNSHNKIQIARIWKAYLFHRLTDLYGDIPYFEATNATTNAIFLPRYDPQELIYKDLLNELEAAALALDPSQPSFDKADLIYEGDVSKWKKLSYSLMLRLGMRMSKIDPALSKTWVNKAIAGGVIRNASDNALMKYTDGPMDFNRNPSAFDPRKMDYAVGSFGKNNVEGGKLSKTFIDKLKEMDDPRISVYAGVWQGTEQNNSPALQKGLPNGTTIAPTPTVQASFSEPNQNTVFRYNAPLMLLSNAETQLYLAEAAVRNWYLEETASSLYEKAVTSSFLNQSIYGASYTISDVSTYLSLNPFKTNGSTAEKMEQIHTQFWIALFVDEQEVYANWRRTEYPSLTPVNFPGNVTNGTIPRRFKYPTSEYAVNSIQLNEAIKRQGPDQFTTRIWWDK